MTNRLLTDEKMQKAINIAMCNYYEQKGVSTNDGYEEWREAQVVSRAIREAQAELTASLKDQECEEKVKQARREIGEWLDGNCCRTGRVRRTCMHCQFALDDALKQGELPEQEGKERKNETG